MRSPTELVQSEVATFRAMSDDELCCVISNTLSALASMKLSGARPDTGVFRFALEEIQLARRILDLRPL